MRVTINGAQVKAARLLLEWTRRDLADKSRLSESTIRNFEIHTQSKPANVMAIRAALESAGVIFVEENGEGPGVRLRKGK
jgi:transcriptional regulator with XRE-family HTH domain